MDIVRDTTATLAALMLAALHAEDDPQHPDQVNFPELPVHTAEMQNALMAHLVNIGELPWDMVEGSYVEPGCTEHGIVHLNMWSLEPTPTNCGWLIICPITGLVEQA